MLSKAIVGRPVRLRDYRYPGELISLSVTFLILIGLYGLATILFPTYWSTTVKTQLVTVAGLGVFILGVKLQQRAAFGTLVRVGPRQFPELHQLASTATERLSSPYIPVYVKRSSEMNIYTLGFRRRPLIVLTSSLVDQMEPGNLQFFIGREIGHIQAGHTWLRAMLKPLGADVPIIGRLLNSVVFGDWINRGELTSDRAGLLSCQSLTTAITAMLQFGVGVRLFEKLDIREFLGQIEDVRNVRGHLTEILAEQPYLTQRIKALVRFSVSETYSDIAPDHKSSTGILKSIPEAFVSAEYHFKEIKGLAAAASSADAGRPSLEHARVEKETVETLFDDPLTMPDYFDLEEANEIDPQCILLGKEGERPVRRLRTRIGRNQDNDIVLESDRISRYHVELIREGAELMVIDKESRNGVWVNGMKLKAPVALKTGDKLRIGRMEFTFMVKE